MVIISGVPIFRIFTVFVLLECQIMLMTLILVIKFGQQNISVKDIGWLVVWFSGPLRQSVYIRPSPREREKEL